MKNILLISSFLAISLLLSSCEQTVTGVELPYKEQLVISCILENGKPLSGVSVEKTLPPLENYSKEKAMVSDAEIKISDGQQDFFLSYRDGFYYSNELIPQSGKTYTLTAKWKNKRATATTTVPVAPTLGDPVYITKEVHYLWGGPSVEVYCTFRIEPEENSAYIGGILGGFMPQIHYSDRIYRYQDKDEAGNIYPVFYFDYYPKEDFDLQYIKNIMKNRTTVVSAFDKQFYNYYVTRWNGESSDAIFGSSGLNVQWNIKGDGIGLFIGRADATKKL